MLARCLGSQAAVPEQLAQHHVPHAESERGQVHPTERLQQVVVPAAAADGAQLTPGIEQLEHRAGVVRQPAHDAEVQVDELAEPHRAKRLERPPERLASRQARRGSPRAEPPRSRPAPGASQRAGAARSCPARSPRRRACPSETSAGVRRSLSSTWYTTGTCASVTPSDRQQRRQQPAIGEPDPHVVGTKPEGAHRVDRQRHDLGVGEMARLADQIAVELEVLSKPPPLLPLVAEELRDGEPADRLLEPVGPRRHHPGERRGHLRPQRHLPPALVDEAVQLPDDLVAALRGVQLQRLQRRTVVLLEPVPRRHLPPGPEDVVPEREIGGIEVAKSRQGLGLHGQDNSGGSGPSERPTSPAPPSRPPPCETTRSPAPSPPRAAPPASAARKSGISVHDARAGGRDASPSQRRSQAASQPRLGRGGSHREHPRSIARSSWTSMSGHSLSPRIETRRVHRSRRPYGRAARDAASACRPGCAPRRTASLPRRSSRPGIHASAKPRAIASGSGRHRGGNAMRMPWATPAFRRWCGPASPSGAGPFVARRASPARRRAPTGRSGPRPGGPRGAARPPAAGSRSPITNGAPGLAMPAFSPAIFSRVSPRYFMWSRSILVTALTSGRTTLVLSSRPPSPTSTTAISGSARREVGEGDRRRRLEEGGPPLQDQRSQARRSTSPPPPPLIGTPSTRIALPERHQVRRGVEPDPPARLAQRGRHEGADASLAVGPADVDRRHDPLRIAQGPEQRPRRGQPELDGGGPGEQEFEAPGRGQRRSGRHATGTPRRARTARSRRATTTPNTGAPPDETAGGAPEQAMHSRQLSSACSASGRCPCM